MLDLAHIEEKLGIKLPDHYVSFISRYESPNPLLENFIYGDSEHLIAVNELIGFCGDEKRVKRRLIIGDNGGGDFYLISLEDTSDENVYYFDHEESVENSFDENTGLWNWDSFEKYESLESYLTELRSMLENED